MSASGLSSVTVTVGVAVIVCVRVMVAVVVSVAVRVMVAVVVNVAVRVMVAVVVTVAVRVMAAVVANVAVRVADGVGVLVKEGVGELAEGIVALALAVALGVLVRVGVLVKVAVALGVKMAVAPSVFVGVLEGVGVFVAVAARKELESLMGLRFSQPVPALRFLSVALASEPEPKTRSNASPRLLASGTGRWRFIAPPTTRKSTSDSHLSYHSPVTKLLPNCHQNGLQYHYPKLRFLPLEGVQKVVGWAPTPSGSAVTPLLVFLHILLHKFKSPAGHPERRIRTCGRFGHSE